MRIAVEANTYYKNFAGSGVYARNIINIWKTEKGKDQFFLFANKRLSEMDLSKKTNRCVRIINGLLGMLWMQVVFPLKLLFFKADILFCSGSIAPIFSPCPVVLTIFDMSFMRYPKTCDFMFRVYLKVLMRFLKYRVAKVITISKFSKSEIVELLNIPESKITVTYLGSSRIFKTIHSEEKIKEIKKSYSASENFILNIGTLEPRKNVISLIEAFSILKEKYGLIHKLVIGGKRGWYYDTIFEKVKELGFGNEVVFTDYIPENVLPLLYNAADLFVYPSLYEGFGLPILEAMACGCPVITSNSSSLPEVVGDAAILVNPLSVDELAQAMLKVLKDNELRSKMVEKGLQRAKMFTWEKTADEILTVLKNVCS